MILVILFTLAAVYMFIRGLVKEYFSRKYGIDDKYLRRYDSSFVSDFWVIAIPYLVIYYILHVSLFRFYYYGKTLGWKIGMYWARYKLDHSREKGYLIVS